MNESPNNAQILIALLKKYGIKNVVHSPGGSNYPIAYPIESDPYFSCYSIVDERSAVFFAIGLSQTLNAPVAMVCTSGTAVSNYSSGMTEAYYKGVPLVAITADRHPYLLDQFEIQKIDQSTIFHNCAKIEVSLPIVNNEDDAWYCQRLVNEALLELNHRGMGPVHINVPTVGSDIKLASKELPNVNMINRIEVGASQEIWESKVEQLRDAKRVLVILGESMPFDDDLSAKVDKFSEKYNCVVSIEHMSGYRGDSGIITYRATEMMSSKAFDQLVPDLVIDACGHIASAGLKELLRARKGNFAHWSIRESGSIRDGFRSLTDIFECTPARFFDYFAKHAASDDLNDRAYVNLWTEAVNRVSLPELSFSNFFIAQSLSERIPKNSILDLGILNSIRTMQFFDLDPSIKVSANIGALGIDGCLSTAIGRSIATDKLCFLVQGDLSFFYDMNALNIRYIKNNLRILVVNNGGGCEFSFGDSKNRKMFSEYFTASHNSTAEGWATSRGLMYIVAKNKEEFRAALEIFVSPDTEAPVLLEAFTDIDGDARLRNSFYSENAFGGMKDKAAKAAKTTAKALVGTSLGNRVFDKMKR